MSGFLLWRLCASFHPPVKSCLRPVTARSISTAVPSVSFSALPLYSCFSNPHSSNIPIAAREPTLRASFPSSPSLDEILASASSVPIRMNRTLLLRPRVRPLTTLSVYVIALYLIFQILTRSADEEILSHLSPSAISHHIAHSALHPSHPSYGGLGALPYHLPHIPSPIPAASSSSTGGSDSPTSPGLWRLLLGLLLYPFYLLVTLLAVPLPYLVATLQLLLSVLATVLYPLTASARLITRTFLLTPLALLQGVLAAFYPVYVFVGGVVGAGCVMGFGAGWVGKVGVELLTRRRGGKGKKSKSQAKASSKKTTSAMRSAAGPEGSRFPRPRSRVEVEEDQSLESHPVRGGKTSARAASVAYTPSTSASRSRPSRKPEDVAFKSQARRTSSSERDIPPHTPTDEVEGLVFPSPPALVEQQLVERGKTEGATARASARSSEAVGVRKRGTRGGDTWGSGAE